VSLSQKAGVLMMEGKEVFRHAVDKMSGWMNQALADAGLSVDAIDWIIPHQANARIIQAIAKKTGQDENKFIMTLDKHANTSAASIPLALAEANQASRFKDGDILALPALGAGLTWGACIIRWLRFEERN